MKYSCTCLNPISNCFSGNCTYCGKEIIKNITLETLGLNPYSPTAKLEQPNITNQPKTNTKEPISAEEYFRLNYSTHFDNNNDRMCYAVDCYDAIQSYSTYLLNFHLEQFAEECKNEIICGNCGGHGYTVEVEAECCHQREDYCCGNPNPIQVQKQCSCYQGINIILPNNIDKTLTDYKLKNKL